MANKEKICTFENKVEPSYLLRKVVELMESQTAKDEIARHSELMKVYLGKTQNGFNVADLFYVTRLLELLAEKISEEPLYRNILQNVLSITKIPPLMTKSSDVFTYDRDLQEYFTSLEEENLSEESDDDENSSGEVSENNEDN